MIIISKKAKSILLEGSTIRCQFCTIFKILKIYYRAGTPQQGLMWYFCSEECLNMFTLRYMEF